MGVDPKIWGPYTWTALHLICEGAPSSISTEVREHFRAFFVHLAYVLPCGKCSEHLQQVLDRHPLGNDVLTREHLIEWCIELHNEVSKDINAAAVPMSVDSARKHWKVVASGDKPAFPAVCTHCGRAAHAHGGAGGSSTSTGSWTLIFCMLIIGIAIGSGATYAIKKKR